ncbi:bestrophin-like domain [Kibdelosporangium banguiense]
MIAVPGYVYLLVVGSMLITAVVMVFAGRRKRAKEGEYNSDALGFVGGVFNALFIVVLAFYTVITWTEADTTEQHTAAEAASLVEIYWQVASVPEPERDQVRALVREYTAEVADREWSLMDQRKSDPKADDLLVALRAEITRIPAEPEPVAAARDAALENVRTVTDERRARIEQATGDSSLLKLLLFGTIVGGVAMVTFPLLIGFSADLRHILSLAALAGILAFTVYFAIELDQPFRGLIRVEPDSFRTALTEYQRIP